jgi:4-hydroxy-4-methyl-2-oxoglutarate aldolase
MVPSMSASYDPLLQTLADVAESALLHEALGKRGALAHTIRPIAPGLRLLGRALTIKGAPGDNLMLHVAISRARPGDVLVAAVENFTEGGLWGEIATVAAQMRGVVGLVTDGAVRDTSTVTKLGFPVFSQGISIKGTTKRQRGTIDQPVCLAGVWVHSGDAVVGDDDGVVVVPAAEIEATAKRAREIRSREAIWLDQLREGASTLDLLNLRPATKELNLD